MFPKLHNSVWPGVVGKGEGNGSEPAIDLETMLAWIFHTRIRM
jgi:hypothetical protein